MKRVVLIDADISLYQVASKAQVDVDWGDGTYTLGSDLEQAKEVFDAEIAGIVKKLEADDYILCISGDHNFRKKHFPTYKQNRKDVRKPLGYNDLREYAKSKHPYKQYDELEADDIIGILQTKVQPIGTQFVTYSEDKDLWTIPGFIWDRDKRKIVLQDELEADKRLWKQILTGDTADGYKGCPGIGKVKAEQIVAKCSTRKEMLGAVYDAYMIHFGNDFTARNEMLDQAQQARILRASNYDFKAKSVKLWNPWEDYGYEQTRQKVPESREESRSEEASESLQGDAGSSEHSS